MFGSEVSFETSIGEYATLKHAPFGLGLHSTTEIKNQITFLHGFVHSVWFEVVFRIEAELVELSKDLLKTSSLLLLKPD